MKPFAQLLWLKILEIAEYHSSSSSSALPLTTASGQGFSSFTFILYSDNEMAELSSGLQDVTDAYLSNLEFARVWQQNLLDWRTVEFTISGQTPQERPFPEPLSTGGRNTLSQNAQAQAYGGNVMPAQRSNLVADQELDPNGGSRDFINADPHPLPSLNWPLSQLADDAPEEEQSSRGDNLTEHARFHHSSGAIVANVVENRKSHGSTSYDEDFGKALYEAAQKAALASPSSNASLEGDDELEEDTNFKNFSKAVLGVPAQYATVPAVSKPREKPEHSCPTCAKHFSRSSTLARHAKSHRGVKDYKCVVCPRAFSRKDLLNRHMSLHDRGTKWVCGAHSRGDVLPDWGCGHEFAREDDLHRHFGSQKGQLCMKSTLPSCFQMKHVLQALSGLCPVDNVLVALSGLCRVDNEGTPFMRYGKH
jgi:hypothetical protein